MSNTQPLPHAADAVSEGKKEACKTYLEQTKLLVTLASAFLFAPPGFIAILKDRRPVEVSYWHVRGFITAECLFITSVLLGYVVLGSIAGSQDEGAFDVFRKATRVFSLLEFLAYVIGLTIFVGVAISAVT